MSNRLDPIEPSALATIPSGLFIMTAQCDGRCDARVVKWVQQCSDRPPMVMVALPKGTPIELLIQDRPRFALCQISADDRYLIRKFTHPRESGNEALITLMTRSTPGGSPIIDRAMTCLDCEIVRHVELDSDFRIYVGQVTHAAVLNRGEPAICLGGNGLANTQRDNV